MFTGRKKTNSGQSGSSGQRKRDRGHEVIVNILPYSDFSVFDTFFVQGRNKNANRMQYFNRGGGYNSLTSESSSVPSTSSGSIYNSQLPNSIGNSTTTGISSNGGNSGSRSGASTSSSSYYRSSVSDMDYNKVAQNTNTRIRSITNRRGAIKHQR